MPNGDVYHGFTGDHLYGDRELQAQIDKLNERFKALEKRLDAVERLLIQLEDDLRKYGGNV